MRQFRHCVVLGLAMLQGFLLFGKEGHAGTALSPYNLVFQDSLDWADYYYNVHRYEKAIDLYQKNLENAGTGKTKILKKLALSEAAIAHPEEASTYINEFLKVDFDPSFLSHEGFDPIRASAPFERISNRVVPKLTVWALLYFFVALIGFYVIGSVVSNKKIDKTARWLISGFIFIHSLFILNISINNSNYLFEFPHAYLISTWSSFLYGPLLYFYFRRITEKYGFRRQDLLHLLPTLGLLIYMIPSVYWMTASDKVVLMLDRIQQGLSPQDSSKLLLLVILKALSLAIYAVYIHKVYQRSKSKKLLQSKNLIWQKNIYHIHVLYVVTYCFYGVLITNSIVSGFLYHVPTIAMAIMVLYVGYVANLQPDVFSGIYKYTNRLFPKYVKSGLTDGLSQELKQTLIRLFAEDKLYRRNDLTLEMVATKLNTTRHNASQIINEHFDANFHELVNSYRIKEAKQMLMTKNQQHLNIIDIAYEVGFNNKVTFNKAFKKDTNLTPTQFIRSSLENQYSKEVR